MAQPLPSESKLQQVKRRYRLDDEIWLRRQATWKRYRWALLAFWTGMGGLVGFAIGKLDSPLLWSWTFAAAGGSALVGALVLVLIPPNPPDSVTLTDAGLEFHRPNGRSFTLRLTGGPTVRLLDQSEYLTSHKPRLGPLPPYLMYHSATTETLSLSKDAFEAIREQFLFRGVTPIQKPTPRLWGKGITIWEYRT